MRHPQATERLARCHNILPEILEAIGHPTTPALIKRHDHGWVNVCFEVDEAIIVRINARDPEMAKFAREAWIYQDTASRQGLPLPRLLLHEERAWAYPVLVTSKLPGHNLATSWSDLAVSQRGELARRAGSLLATMHAVHDFGVEGHGELVKSREHGGGERGTLAQSVSARLAHHVEQAMVHDALPEEVARRIEEACLAILARHDTERCAVLAHRDFHFGNLLHDGGAITGVVDFEWSMACDRGEDLMTWRRIAHLYEGANAPFLEGYAQVAGDDCVREEPALEAVYEAMGAVELATVARRFYTREEAARYAERAVNALDVLQVVE